MGKVYFGELFIKISGKCIMSKCHYSSSLNNATFELALSLKLVVTGEAFHGAVSEIVRLLALQPFKQIPEYFSIEHSPSAMGFALVFHWDVYHIGREPMTVLFLVKT